MTGIHRDKAEEIFNALQLFSEEVHPLLGIVSEAERRACTDQLISSLRRVSYVTQLANRELSPKRADPTDWRFDPLMAAALAMRKGDIDNAWWLAFIATHFGKHPTDGWRLTRDFYGAFERQLPWTWQNTSKDPEKLFSWLMDDWPKLLNDRVSRRFSNHRKYESKKPGALIQVFSSYIDLIMSQGTHTALMNNVHKTVGQHENAAFDELYIRMNAVKRFGRLGTFDFLAMLGKLGIAPISPGKAYLKNATGPLAGTKLFIYGDSTAPVNADELENILYKLDQRLNVGKQVLEDALCNWQKSPKKFVLFRG